MKAALAFIVALSIGVTAMAEPDDYARGIIVEPSDRRAIARVAIPAAVYETVTSSRLDDLAVYNGDGDPVPFAIRRPPAATAGWSDWQDLPVFALPPAPATGEGLSRINVELAGDGTVIAIEGLDGVPRSTTDSGRVLIDAGDYDGPVDGLRIAWAETAVDFIVPVRVEASTDLANWRTVNGNSALAALHTGDHTILEDRIELPSVSEPYLRLTLLDSVASPGSAASLESARPLQIHRVAARTRREQPVVRASKTLTGVHVVHETRTVLEFDSGGSFPVDRVSLALPQSNQAINASILSRASAPESVWELQGNHLFYRIDAAFDSRTESRNSAALAVTRTTDRHWRLQTRQDLGASVPELVISWLPHELVFLRQGPGPYTVAFGRAGAESSRWPLARLRAMVDSNESLDDLRYAAATAPRTLGGLKALAPPPQPLPWQQIALWSVLVLGVLVIAGFAWHLARGGATRDPNPE